MHASARLMAVSLLCAALGGCGSGGTVAGAVLQAAGMRPPPELPDAQKPARDVTIRLHAAPTLNSGGNGPPVALVARIYQLRQADAFGRAPWAAFLDAGAERALLGADVLEVKEVLLTPGQRYEVTERVARAAGYVGIVALFRAPDGQRWRAAFPAAAAEKDGITVGLHGCALAVGQGAAPLGAAAAPSPRSHCTESTDIRAMEDTMTFATQQVAR